MRLVATSDTHFPVNMPIPDGDVFIHAGDLMQSGTPDEWNANLEWLSKLTHKTKIFVPGNHDFHFIVYPGPAVQQMRQMGFVVLGMPDNPEYESTILPNGMKVLGLPFVKNLSRWCFNTTEEEMDKYLSDKGRYDIVISHSPMTGVLDLGRSGASYGIDAYTDYCKKHNPKVWIHGHVHEQFGHHRFNKTDVYNVSMSNRNKEHANSPIVIDI